MFKTQLKICAGIVGLLIFCSAFVALFATVSNDEAAAYIGQYSGHQLAGIAPGQIYEFVNGEPTGVPVCRLRDLSDVLVHGAMGDMEFRNVLGASIPFVANLYRALANEQHLATPEGAPAGGFFSIRWHNVVELYIPAQDIPGIDRGCESTVESLVTNGGSVCIVQRVMHNGTSEGVVYAYDWRRPCIQRCSDESCRTSTGNTPGLSPEVGIRSKIKIELGLITREIIAAANPDTHNGVAAVLLD